MIKTPKDVISFLVFGYFFFFLFCAIVCGIYGHVFGNLDGHIFLFLLFAVTGKFLQLRIRIVTLDNYICIMTRFVVNFDIRVFDVRMDITVAIDSIFNRWIILTFDCR